MSKLKRFLQIYAHLIMLIWIFSILLIFKIICNFQFRNGSSLLFVGLIVSVPVALIIFLSVNKRKVKKETQQKTVHYLERIKADIHRGKFEQLFLKRVKEMLGSCEPKINVQGIQIIHPTIYIYFLNERAVIGLVNTKVTYSFYYSYQYNNLTKYDSKNFQRKDTQVLYISMIQCLEKLALESLVYKENVNHWSLTRQNSKEVIYYLVEQDKKEQKKNKKINKKPVEFRITIQK